MANRTKKIVKKKTKTSKAQNMQKSQSGKAEDTAQKTREEQFSKLEERKSQQYALKHTGIERLEEALILSEIVGRPRCKARRNRGQSRRYGS